MRQIDRWCELWPSSTSLFSLSFTVGTPAPFSPRCWVKDSWVLWFILEDVSFLRFTAVQLFMSNNFWSSFFPCLCPACNIQPPHTAVLVSIKTLTWHWDSSGQWVFIMSATGRSSFYNAVFIIHWLLVKILNALLLLLFLHSSITTLLQWCTAGIHMQKWPNHINCRTSSYWLHPQTCECGGEFTQSDLLL